MRYCFLFQGGSWDSLLKVEEGETDAVLDENSEVLSLHHDRPVGENKGVLASWEEEEETRDFLPRDHLSCWMLPTGQLVMASLGPTAGGGGGGRAGG